MFFVFLVHATASQPNGTLPTDKPADNRHGPTASDPPSPLSPPGVGSDLLTVSSERFTFTTGRAGQASDRPVDAAPDGELSASRGLIANGSHITAIGHAWSTRRKPPAARQPIRRNGSTATAAP